VHWETDSAEEVGRRVVHAVTEAIPTKKGYDVDDIQVLAAQYGDSGSAEPSPMGVVGLNHALQEAINPANSREGDVFIGRRYSARTKDRVINVRNNYDLGVMNGEIGKVVDADPAGLDAEEWLHATWSGKGDVDVDLEEDADEDTDDEMVAKETYGGLERKIVEGREKLVFKDARVLAVEFNGGTRTVLFTKDEARDLELGYCVTVHKSQGSQFKAVVIVAHSGHQFMLTRSLLYTGITRAAEFCLSVGEQEQVAKSARNTRGSERRTMLQEYLSTAD